MPQPILIAPRGPHRFIPSGEGASPSPVGPLNARGWVRQPPWGGPPWPPLLPWPRKQKISGCRTPRFCRVRIVFSKRFAHVPLTYTPATGFQLILFTCHTCFLGKKGCHTFFSEISRPCATYIRHPPSFFCFWLFWLWFFTKDGHNNCLEQISSFFVLRTFQIC